MAFKGPFVDNQCISPIWQHHSSSVSFFNLCLQADTNFDTSASLQPPHTTRIHAHTFLVHTQACEPNATSYLSLHLYLKSYTSTHPFSRVTRRLAFKYDDNSLLCFVEMIMWKNLCDELILVVGQQRVSRVAAQWSERQA